MTAATNRILIIDDDPLFRSLIVSAVGSHYEVSVAAEGAEGYYKALESVPDVAVIDVKMPGWDGLKTLKAFRAHRTLSKVPVMMLTGDASKRTVVTAIAEGTDDYVVKSAFTRQEFLDKIEHLLNRDHVRAPAAKSDCAHSDAEAPELVHARGGESPQLATASTQPTHPQSAVACQTAHEASDIQEIIDSWE